MARQAEWTKGWLRLNGCIADVPIGGARKTGARSGGGRHAGLETRDTADLEVCGTTTGHRDSFFTGAVTGCALLGLLLLSALPECFDLSLGVSSIWFLMFIFVSVLFVVFVVASAQAPLFHALPARCCTRVCVMSLVMQ
jgi:hypothetical protein